MLLWLLRCQEGKAQCRFRVEELTSLCSDVVDGDVLRNAGVADNNAIMLKIWILRNAQLQT